MEFYKKLHVEDFRASLIVEVRMVAPYTDQRGLKETRDLLQLVGLGHSNSMKLVWCEAVGGGRYTVGAKFLITN